jgi:hypothetical protein
MMTEDAAGLSWLLQFSLVFIFENWRGKKSMRVIFLIGR